MKFGFIVALGTVADRKLNGEINAETDKQNGKCNRYQIECTDHHKAERSSERNPTNRLMKTATISRPDFSASQRITSTIRMVAMAFSKAPCLTVPNSSSAIGTEPVRRTRAWYFCLSCKSDAA